MLSAPLVLDGLDHGLQLPFLIPAQGRSFVLAVDEQQVDDAMRRKIEIMRSRSTAFSLPPSRSAHTDLAEATGTGIGITGSRIGQQLAL